MDIKKYIASGILEQYVLGLASEKDRLEVERYIDQYPEIKKELEAIEKSLELFAEANQMEPSRDLESDILDAVNKTKVNSPAIKTEINKYPWWIWLLLSALILSLLVAGYFYNEHSKNTSALQNRTNELNTLKSDCDNQGRIIDDLKEQINILMDTRNIRYDMKRKDQAIASVYYNSTTQKSYLNLDDVPAPPSDRQYQLWALVDGVPVDMGFFQVSASDDSTLLEVPFIENAGVFAVTLEPDDGNPAPNLEELYMISG